MSSKMIALAIAGAMSVPVAAQTAPQANAEITQTEAPKPQTVMKKVCTRVIDEEATGSRLSNSHRVCKMVEVPAPATGQQPPAATGNSGN